MYNWQYKNWPQFEFNESSVMKEDLLKFMLYEGVVNGIVAALPQDVSMESIVEILVSEALKTSEIEGEMLSREDVMSSIKNNLSLKVNQSPKNKNAIGLSKMLIDVRNTYADPLTESKLLEWHELLMGNNKMINAGAWRKHKSPMQVISGAASNPTVHFEAPPSAEIPKEMKAFVHWYNKSEIKNPLIKSAVAHIYFESIHPFEDGNGRIGRAISEKALSQGLNAPVIFSLSKALEAKRKEYYNELKKGQQTLTINTWIEWFSSVVLDAQRNADKMIRFTIKKIRFFEKYDIAINERQRKAINKMLENAPEKFKGGMNNKKYISITSTSKATATRDLQELVELNIFKVIGGGRSTSYELII